MVLFNTDLIINLDLVTTLVAIVSVYTTSSFASTAVSSSVLTSLASDFLIGGTPTTTTSTTDILTLRLLRLFARIRLPVLVRSGRRGPNGACPAWLLTRTD